MKAPRRKPATYEDLEGLPDTVIGEILNGELIASPRPAVEHAQASSVLGMELGGPFSRGRGGPGGWWILDEPELHLGKDVLVPDLAGWRRERMASPPRGAYLTLSPDWVCEVVSPSTAGVDRVRKLPIYAREKVRHVWLLDPQGKTLEVLRLEEGGWKLVASFAESDRVRAEPFEAVELELEALWLPEEVATPAG